MLSPSMLLRLWQTARYRQLMRKLLEGRVEAGLRVDERLGGPLAAGAVALLRLGELNQAHLPIATELRQRLLLSQNRDGSWGDSLPERAMLTALCIRGLHAVAGQRVDHAAPYGLRWIPLDVQGRGISIERAIRHGLRHLGHAQERYGGWAGDLFATGFVLLELARVPGFRESVRVAEALELLDAAEGGLDTETSLLFSRVEQRFGRRLRLAGRSAPRGLLARREVSLLAGVA